MKASALRGLLAAAALAVTWPTHAQAPAPAALRPDATPATPQSCQLPASDRDVLTDRAGQLAQYERLPRPCLQQIFAACNDASGQAMLDFGSAAVCSFGYEALLRQQFNGNFGELLAWWNARRGTAVD